MNSEINIKLKSFLTRKALYFELLKIFLLTRLVYYLNRDFAASTRAFNLQNCAFNLSTRGFNLATRVLIPWF